MVKQNEITVKGARVNNLKNIDIVIPRDKLVVITGLSGSGKSSLAFDTLYAEGQRRYVESLSSYARQFLGQMEKPDVDMIEGLSPAISIDQKTTNHNPRSTVGTVTEINDYLRLLFARVGRPLCPTHNIEIKAQTIGQMVERIMQLPERTRISLLAPLVRGKKGEHKKLLQDIKKEGYVRVRVDGIIYDVSDDITIEKNKKHTIDIIVDRVVVKEGIETRLSDSLEAALRLADGYAVIDVVDGEELLFSEHYACPYCGFNVGELEPRLFSFNAPYGACETCDGLGRTLKADVELVIPDTSKTLNEGAIVAWNPISTKYYPQMLASACRDFNIAMDVPFAELAEADKKLLLWGSGERLFHFHYTNEFGNTKDVDIVFEGVLNNIERRYKETSSDFVRDTMLTYMAEQPCKACVGYRLNEKARAVKIAGCHIGEVCELAISDSIEWIETLALSAQDTQIAAPIVKEVSNRLGFLDNVGLEYLTLGRTAGTLSGGEAQRIRLATQIGSKLSGVLYILDEPSIGLHQRDNDRLIQTLKDMRDLGNTLIVVEHDEDTMLAADYLIDVGPGAGEHGGEIVAAGTPEKVMKSRKSLTGKYLSGKAFIPVPVTRRSGNGNFLSVKGATENNLKNVDVNIPLNTFTVVTGVSGSGKSTLVNEIIRKSLSRQVNRANVKPGKHQSITGIEHIEKVIDINQAPIGRTPRSNPATYTGVFDDVRDLFSVTNEAKVRGYKKGRFSFNVKGGRCEACRGDGILKIEMHFLPDVYVPCEVCQGKRYNSETLDVHYRGKNISDILGMTIEEGVTFFKNVPKIERKLQTLVDVGLGYVRLGQPATTLSGGEAQRVKLASELHKRSNGKSFYILDEPTTGLHADDIKRLLTVMQRLVDNGDSVLVIEHNLDVIKQGDYVIDLGPEGGSGGGQIIATGTPEEICTVDASYTGKYLKAVMTRDKNRTTAKVKATQ